MADVTLQTTPQLLPADVEYPTTDGRPMAETDVHRDIMVYLIEALKAHFQDDPQTYIAGNIFIYYEKGDLHSRVAPDVFVVFGVPQRLRRVYRLWEEGKGPNVVLEISSRGTRREDLWEKRGLYEFLGVEEYFLFDPLDEYLSPPLQGYRLLEGEYHKLESQQGAKKEWRLDSQQLGLELYTERNFLRLYDPVQGKKFLTPLEAQTRVRQAEARIAELEAELARLRGKD